VLVSAPPLKLPDGIRAGATLISDLALRRLLGLAAPGENHRHLTAEEIQRSSGLGPDTIACLALYDVVDPAEGLYSFRDLLAAREARRLLNRGFGLREIVEAALELRSSGRGLFDTSVADGPWGELMQQVGGRLGQLDGQLVLPLEDAGESVDEVFARAETCERTGDLDGAERLYTIALRLDTTDPVIPFNLGNVLDALGRRPEALLRYQQALARDGTFADAWINMAAVYEAEARAGEAEASLRRAVETRPEFAAARFNLALLLTKSRRFSEAVEAWDRYLSLRPSPASAKAATRLRTMCRIENSAGQGNART
jgi:tetratricopeptide (TPR) repeat protein